MSRTKSNRSACRAKKENSIVASSTGIIAQVPSMDNPSRVKCTFSLRCFSGQITMHYGMLSLLHLPRAHTHILTRLAILGLTYQFTSNLIDRERYDTYVSVFANEVARLNIHGQELHQAGATGTFITGPTDRSIRPSEELRFMLFRHWNLYDSMFHSGYVAGKLRLWREKGRKNLVGLLAKMGLVHFCSGRTKLNNWLI